MTVLLGCGDGGPAGSPSPLSSGSQARSTVCPFVLTIKTEAEPTRDRLPVRVMVKNRSDKDMGWDKEFASFLVWRVKVDGADDALAPKTVARVPKDKGPATKDRFVRVPPGEERTEVVDLVKGFKGFDYLPIVGLGDPRNEVAVEEQRRFEIPPSAKAIIVQLEYRGLSPWAFEGLYGVKTEDVGLWYGYTTSNELRIPLK
jgi:hypothetical protein